MSQQSLEIELRRLRERFEEQPEGRVFAPLADTHRKLGQLDDALQICLTGLARHPEYSSAFVILGKIHLERGDDESAREAFERVLDLDSQNLLALRHLAKMDEDGGSLEDAVVRWEQLLQLVPDAEIAETHLLALRRRLGWSAGDDEEADADEESEGSETDDGAESRGEGPEASAAPEASEGSATEPQEPHVDLPAAELEETEVESIAADAALEEATRDDGLAPDSSAPTEEVGATAGPPSGPRIAGMPDGVPASEIATMTLAEIYAEQGFKAKALEVYRQVRERSPHVEGIDARIASIEADLSRLPRPTAPADMTLRELESPSSDPGRGDALDSSDSDGDPLADGATPSPPLTAPEHGEADAERERRDHFRTWLDRIKVRDS